MRHLLLFNMRLSRRTGIASIQRAAFAWRLSAGSAFPWPRHLVHLPRCGRSVPDWPARALLLGSAGRSVPSSAADDSRIIVIHRKIRMGVGAARNIGLRVAKGLYLAFLDSDDWIDSQMYEAMISGIRYSKSELAICRHKKVYTNKVIDGSTNTAVLLEGDELIEKYILSCEGIRDSSMLLLGVMWNKLFKRSLIQNISFSDGVHEDMQVSFQIMAKCENSIYLDTGYYNYRIDRVGSLMKDNTPINRWKLFIERRSEISSYFRKNNRNDLAVAWDYYRLAFRTFGNSKKWICVRINLISDMQQLIVKKIKKEKSPVGSNREKILLTLFLLSPDFFICIAECDTVFKQLLKKIGYRERNG